VEHGGTRAQYARVVAAHYRAEYESVFGALPDEHRIPNRGGPHGDTVERQTWEALDPSSRDSVTRVFVNVVKAIAAYERRLQYGPSRFDRWADALVASGRSPDGIMNRDEVDGLRLFVGKAQCVNCHNGPLFTDQHFHNTGVAAREGLPDDIGRASGAPRARNDEFNCTSPWSDASPDACTALAFMVDEGDELRRAFKTPSLRNVAERAPYMHAGQVADLDDVVRHYDRAPKAPAGSSELRPLGLSARERAQLLAFLRSLSAPLAAPRHLLEPPR
jgi:cytochrome c peroxidase